MLTQFLAQAEAQGAMAFPAVAAPMHANRRSRTLSIFQAATCSRPVKASINVSAPESEVIYWVRAMWSSFTWLGPWILALTLSCLGPASPPVPCWLSGFCPFFAGAPLPLTTALGILLLGRGLEHGVDPELLGACISGCPMLALSLLPLPCRSSLAAFCSSGAVPIHMLAQPDVPHDAPLLLHIHIRQHLLWWRLPVLASVVLLGCCPRRSALSVAALHVGMVWS